MGLLSHERITHPDGKGLANDLQRFVHDAERIVKDIQGLTGSGFSSARSELENHLARAKAGIADASRSALQHAGETKEVVTDYMSRRPVASLAVAVAVGALIAFAISRIGARRSNEPFIWDR